MRRASRDRSAQLGIEATTGPLGQGIANAVGMAVAEAKLDARFGRELVDHHTYAFVGDGCLQEGIGQEMISLAGHLRLGKLIFLWDDNRITDDGGTELVDLARTCRRAFASPAGTWSKWTGTMSRRSRRRSRAPRRIRGPPDRLPHRDRPRHAAAAGPARRPWRARLRGDSPRRARRGAGDRPASRCRTTSCAPGGRERAGAAGPTYAHWTGAPGRAGCRRARRVRRAGRRRACRRAGRTCSAPCQAPRSPRPGRHARRSRSRPRSTACSPRPCPSCCRGAPDLEGPTSHKQALAAFTAQDRSGRYLHYGIREHAMGAMMNGIAAHRGLVPVGVTYLVFSDYMRPALRMAALMGLPVIRLQPRLDRHRPQRPDPSAGRVSWPPCAPSPTCWCCVPPTRSRRSNAGRWRSPTATARPR